MMVVLGAALPSRPEVAFLGSWVFALKEVAGSMGISSWGGFLARCPPLADSLAQAEAKLVGEAGGTLQPVDWIGLLSEPKAKLQSFWSAKMQERRKAALLTSLGQDDQVDVHSAGGPGAGGFLEVPVPF